MKNSLYFMLKALFILYIFTFLSWLFGYVEKRFSNKAMVNFKIYDITNWTTNGYNKHIYPISQQVKVIKHINFDQLIECCVKNIFLQKLCRIWGKRLDPGLFLFSRKALYNLKAADQHLILIYFVNVTRHIHEGVYSNWLHKPILRLSNLFQISWAFALF